MRPFSEIAQIVAQSRASPAASEHIEEKDYGGMLLQEWETINKRVERAFADRPKDVRRDWKQMTIEIFMCMEDTNVKVEQWYFGYTGQPAFTVRFERVLYRSLYYHLRLLPAHALKSKRLRHLRFEVSISADKPADTISRNNECMIMKFVDGKGAMRLSYDYRDDLFDLLQQSGKRPATVTTAPLIDNTSAMDVSGGNPPYDDRGTSVDRSIRPRLHSDPSNAQLGTSAPPPRNADAPREEAYARRPPPPTSSLLLAAHSRITGDNIRSRSSSHGASTISHGAGINMQYNDATTTNAHLALQQQRIPPFSQHQHEQHTPQHAVDRPVAPYHSGELSSAVDEYDGRIPGADNHIPTPAPMTGTSAAIPIGRTVEFAVPHPRTAASSAPVTIPMRQRVSTMPEHDLRPRRQPTTHDPSPQPYGHAPHEHPPPRASEGIQHAGASLPYGHERGYRDEQFRGGSSTSSHDHRNLRGHNVSAAVPIATTRPRGGSAGNQPTRRPHPTSHSAGSLDTDTRWRPGSLPNAPPRAHPSGQHSPSQCDVPYGLPFARSYGSSWNDHDNHAGTSDGSAQDGAGTNAYSRGSATSSLRASGKPSPLSHSFGSGGGSHPLRVSFLHSKLSPNTASDGLSDSHQSLASQDLESSNISSGDDDIPVPVEDVDLAFEHLPFAWEDKEEVELETFKSKISAVPKLNMFAAARQDIASSMSHLDIEVRACHNEAELFDQSLIG